MQVTQGLVFPFGYGLAFSDWVDVTSPSAGANASVLVGGEVTVRLVAARAKLTTSAAAANRLLSIDFVNARSTTYCRNMAAVVVTANTTNQAFEWNRGRTDSEWNTNTPVLVPLLPSFLPPGFSIKFTVDNIDAADQLSGLSLWVEKYPTGKRGYPSGAVGVDVEPVGDGY